MLDIFDELRKLVAELDHHAVDYALCGGMAMGVHGVVRATIDIDLMVHGSSVDEVFAIGKSLGYNIRGKKMNFSNGEVEIRRASKIDPEDGELLSLDLILVTPATLSAWESRVKTEWEGGDSK